MDLNRKTLAAVLVITGAGLLIFTAAELHPLAGFALAGVCLVAASSGPWHGPVTLRNASRSMT
jgi:p-aminobenzoyl-glutamate transporter AbgT